MSTSAIVEARVAELNEKGFCIIPSVLPRAFISALDTSLALVFERTPCSRGNFYGESTKRFGRLLVRDRRVASLVQHRLILEIVETVLGPFCDRIQLNVTQAIEIHPGELAQAPHRDQDMWAGEKGRIEYLLNVIWPLTPFTHENGATMIWPGSHGRHALEEEPHGDAVAAECVPGAAILFLGSTLHGAGPNCSTGARRGLVIGYSLGWLKAYENPYLAYPPQVARTFSPELAALVGYRQHRPNLGNFEGQCPSVALGNNLPDTPGAIDALRPDQEAMVAAHLARERASASASPVP